MNRDLEEGWKRFIGGRIEKQVYVPKDGRPSGGVRPPEGGGLPAKPKPAPAQPTAPTVPAEPPTGDPRTGT